MSAPDDEIMAPSFRIASSYSCAGGALRLRWIFVISKPACEKYSKSAANNWEGASASVHHGGSETSR